MLFEIYIFIATSLLLGFCVFDEEVREKINVVLKEFNIFIVIFGMTMVIMLTPIAVVAGLLKRKK